ncbi:chromodomain-helicase-DNA-binding protein 4 [Apostasia shenzhenica]|uniref:Chromodomain-helicase-DNA-binding protein 4 n=1 Tax=Apostasia shenzhenica TaxID=1088818 RepID=A0A2I0AW36_9ASPA|nr:chromodomain-helicase-DNA-binding protein 4 [Apostasia shenzhenica]
MGKEGDSFGATGGSKLKRGRKRRLVLSSDSETDEFVGSTLVAKDRARNGSEGGRGGGAEDKGAGGERRVTRAEMLRRRSSVEDGKEKVSELKSDKNVREIDGDESKDSVGNKNESLEGGNERSDSQKHGERAKEKVPGSQFNRKKCIETRDEEVRRKKIKSDQTEDTVDTQIEKICNKDFEGSKENVSELRSGRKIREIDGHGSMDSMSYKTESANKSSDSQKHGEHTNEKLLGSQFNRKKIYMAMDGEEVCRNINSNPTKNTVCTRIEETSNEEFEGCKEKVSELRSGRKGGEIDGDEPINSVGSKTESAEGGNMCLDSQKHGGRAKENVSGSQLSRKKHMEIGDEEVRRNRMRSDPTEDTRDTQIAKTHNKDFEDSKEKVPELKSDMKSDKKIREIDRDESMYSMCNKTESTEGRNKRSDSQKHGERTKDVSGPQYIRKRCMEIADDEVSRKKIKSNPTEDTMDLRIEKTSNKDLNYVKHKETHMGSRNIRVHGSKLSVNGTKSRDGHGLTERKLQLSSNKNAKGGVGSRELRNLKDHSFSVALDRKKVGDGGSSEPKYIRVQERRGVLRVLQSTRKTCGTEKSNTKCDFGGNKRTLRSSSTHDLSKLNHSAERKTVCGIKLKMSAVEVPAANTGKLHVPKIKEETVSPKKYPASVSVLHGTSGMISRGEANTKTNGSRSEAKKQLREQIKKILLDAGWKIELRPRRGRDYEDAVYVSPRGTGYWSITKAYDVYKAQFKSGCYGQESSGKQSKSFDVSDRNFCGPSSTFSAIDPEVLLMLKRNVVNKRRKKKEAKELKHKAGVHRCKETAKGKCSKAKRSREDVGGSRIVRRKVIIRNNKRSGCALLVRGSNLDDGSEASVYAPYVWKRTILSWMIDLGVLPAYGKVKYMNKRKTRTLLDGRITRDGIQCSCCSKILTVSKFEIHAGSKMFQPYENIYVELSGKCLLQCQLDAWKKQESEWRSFHEVDTEGDDPNDDTCSICGDGGDLICCDGCPSTFHLNCLGIQMLPSGDWHCTNCCCKFCSAAYNSASPGEDVDDTLLTCFQCERKYHKECVPEDDAVFDVSNSSCYTFCGKSCRKVFRQLRKLTGVKKELDAGFSWSLIQRFEDPSKSPSRLAQRVESNSKIAVAYAIMDECFVPITDQRSGINLIHSVVYNCGKFLHKKLVLFDVKKDHAVALCFLIDVSILFVSNFNRLNYGGFYTFVLERGDELISAASVRIHGTRLAEMPFIGTRSMYRRQGMCRRLLEGIESALHTVGVEQLVIPAISELTDTWTTVFSFKPLGDSQKEEVKSVNMLVFPGIGLLHKSLQSDSKNKQMNPDLAPSKCEPGLIYHVDGENKPGIQGSVEADFPRSVEDEESIDNKKSKRDVESEGPINLILVQPASDLLPEESGLQDPKCCSSDSAPIAKPDVSNAVSCSSPIREDKSHRCSNNMVVLAKEPTIETETGKDALPFEQSSSEVLPDATGVHDSEWENSSNSGLTVKAGEICISGEESKYKPPCNGRTHDVTDRKIEDNEFSFIQAADGLSLSDQMRLRRATEGLNSNENEENDVVSIDVRRDLNASHANRHGPSEACGKGSSVDSKLLSKFGSSDECNYQEKSELIQDQPKGDTKTNTAKCLDVDGGSHFVGTNAISNAADVSRNNIIKSTHIVNGLAKISADDVGGEICTTLGYDCYDGACDVSTPKEDLGVAEPVHVFELATVKHASKMLT